MEKTIDDYRVVESFDGFTIQIKSVITNTFGRLWWRKTETKVLWHSLNNEGMKIYNIFEPQIKAEIYESLEDAKLAIEKFVKYPIYHYAVQQAIFPSREPNSFCETPEEKCTANHCDDNGCQNRKRENVDECPFPKFPIDEPTE